MTLPTNLDRVERRATASVIADVIRERVIDGSFPPGAQLGEVQLAEQLGVSRGPVREALQRLIQEGLLEGRPHRGVFVARLRGDDVVDVYRARRAVERAAAELLVDRADRAALDDLAGLVARMEDAAERGHWSDVVDLDRQFHETLVSAAGSPRLARMFRTLLAETAMCMAALEPAYPVRRDIAGEHRMLLEALATGDTERVRSCIEEHLDHAVRHLAGRPLAVAPRRPGGSVA